MLKLRIDDFMIIGLDANNVAELQADHPAIIDMTPFQGVKEMMICFKPTLQELHAMLSERIPLPPLEMLEALREEIEKRPPKGTH